MDKAFKSIDDFWHWIHAVPVREVNISTTFMTRGRCKLCGELPTTYCNVRLASFYLTPYEKIKNTDWAKPFYKKTNVDALMSLPPSIETKLQDFSHQLNYKGYSPRLHRTQSLKTNMIEYASCECRQTVWIIPHMYNVLLEHIGRRGRYDYPTKLKYQY